MPFGALPAGPDDLFARSVAGAKSYLEWLQAGAAGSASPAPDWPRQMQQMFAGALAGGGQPFAGFAPGSVPPWQAPHGMPGVEPVAAFGYTREQQLQQQALAAAMVEYLETASRYQSLIQQANAQGAVRMQEKLARRAEAGQPVESLKALYDLWVDAAEDAYAEAALSDEFRAAFGAMSNAQMRLRQLQQQQAEQWCRELGMPTRSEVDSLGRRLQEVRREMRGREPSNASVAALRAEVAALERRLDALDGKPASAVKTSVRPSAAKTAKPAPAKRKTAAAGRSPAAGRRK
jgi:hypothetical protein